MSDRGSILISTANDIGEALVEKLGGEGYAPSVWDKEYNKLGIAEVDSAPALSVLEDSSETGTARGSILLSTANAIGAMLNKKYNTDRGFKPKEWASAGRKMKPLETDTKSGSIVNIQGAKETPLLSLVGTIDPTISGTSEVEAYKLGKNLINANDESKTFSADVITNYEVAYLDLKKGVTYTFSAYQNTAITGSTRNTLRITFDGVFTYENTGTNFHNNIGVHSMSITPTKDGTAVFAIWAHTPAEDVTYSDFMVEVGSSASEYVPYEEPTTYTADLGETVHGGTADIINGAGSETYTKVKLSDLTWTQGTAGGREYYNAVIATAETTNTHDIVTDLTYSGMVTVANMTDKSIAKWQQSVRIYDTDISSVSQLLETYGDEYIVYPNRYTVDFTFDGQEINTSGDVENYYTSAGNTSIEYYAVPTPYTRGAASGAIANVQSARTDLPFTMVKANIAPNLTGVESVEVTKAGKNLFDKENPNEVDGYITTTGFSTSNTSAKTIYIPIVGGATYTVSKTAGQRFSLATAEVIPSNNAVFTGRQANNTATSISITAGANDKYLWAWIYLDGTDSGTLEDMISSVQIEAGSSATEYTPYEEPTVYTADLGEPVYGGSVDLVSGEVVKDCTKGSMSSTYLSGLNSDYIGYEASTAYFNNHPSIWVRNWNYQTAAARTAGGIKCDCNEFPASMNNTTIFASQYRIYFDVNGKNITSVQDFIDYVEDLEQNGKSLDITYEVATPTESSITPQVISPSEGVNNLWNNAGGDTDVEYFEQE